MQQLETSKQIVEEEQRCKRECKGRALAISRRIYRLLNTDVYYVESESSDNIYYFVKFKPDVIEFCSCMDSSTRNVRCKHLYSIEFAIRLGTLKDTDRLPSDAKVSKVVATATVSAATPTAKVSKSYTQDDYSF